MGFITMHAKGISYAGKEVVPAKVFNTILRHLKVQGCKVDKDEFLSDLYTRFRAVELDVTIDCNWDVGLVSVNLTTNLLKDYRQREKFSEFAKGLYDCLLEEFKAAVTYELVDYPILTEARRAVTAVK